MLLPLFARLHDVGTARDKAGNRRLHFDQYCMLVLLSFFNPMLRSVRALQAASKLKSVQRRLGCPRTSLGSFSEATDVFDPERLRPIIGELLDRARPIRRVGRGHVAHVLTAVDGSVIRTLATLVEAAYHTDRNGESHGGWRLHTHFEIDRHVPVQIDVTSARHSGELDERARLRKSIEADRCYVMDRGYAQFVLWNEIVAAGSSYVCRIRDNSNLNAVVEERPLSKEARAAGVIGDLIVTLGTTQKKAALPNHQVRVILVKTTPYRKQGGRKGSQAGPSSDGTLRIATNLLDAPAEIIADIYKHRWTIELFFRFFKHILGCRHLLSTDPVGIQIQSYCAIIACLLISLWTGRKPSLRTFEMVCLYFQGWADMEELLEHINGLPPVVM
jgi:hypothetical protein